MSTEKDGISLDIYLLIYIRKTKTNSPSFSKTKNFSKLFCFT